MLGGLRFRAFHKTAQADRQEARAEQLRDTAAAVVSPVVQPDVPKVAGVSRREVWSAVVVTFRELIKAVAEGKAVRALNPDSISNQIPNVNAVLQRFLLYKHQFFAIRRST